MRKILSTLLFGLCILFAILFARAQLTFEQRQLSSSGPVTDPLTDQQAAIARLSQAIQIPTISWDEPDQIDHDAFARFHQFLASAFPLVHQNAEKTTINQHSLIYHLPGSNPSLQPALLLAHMDVVPVDPQTLDEWQHGPFSGKYENGIVYGRGAMDDKGGLIGLMEAIETLLKSGWRPERDIYLAFGHDEEIGGKQGAAKIAEHFVKQGLRFEFVLDEGGAITEGLMQGFNQPIALIGVAEKGYVNLHLQVDGEGGHSSQPPRHTAAGVLSQAIVNLEANPLPANLQFMRMTFDAIGAWADWPTRLVMANLWLTEPLVEQVLMSQPKLAASLHTTMAATMLQGSSKSNILPTRAQAVVNVRLFPGDTAEDIKTYAAQAIDNPQVKLSLSHDNPPSAVSGIEAPSFARISQAIRDLHPDALVAPYLVQGGTDSKHFYKVSDNIYRFLPFRANKASLARMHGIDEQIGVAEYLDLIRFYHRLISQL